MNNRLTVNHVGLSQCESKVKQSTYNCWYFLTTALSWSHAPKHTFSTRQYLCAIPANSWHDKTWPSSTRLHREADWNEDRRTRGGVTRPWSLAWTCGRVGWSTTTRLEREIHNPHTYQGSHDWKTSVNSNSNIWTDLHRAFSLRWQEFSWLPRG